MAFIPLDADPEEFIFKHSDGNLPDSVETLERSALT